MARRNATRESEPFEERIVDIDVTDEMSNSYLQYSYSVIYSRALPDARDGLKPVHRRILYQMGEMGLRPDRGFVKSARVVGEVMGRLHPHGDGAIYDALVRLAQPFSMRLPLADGHGNFGSLGNDDPPAAMRYTEARLSPAALLMTNDLGEGTVDFGPNYDGQETEPLVLPAAFPNLLVNGTTGIAVGMATNMPPHNLGEVVAAARHLIKHPEATLEELVRIVPGPDLPTGGRIVGLDGVRDAYASGRGVFRIRASAHVEPIGRRQAIVVTELPYNIGPEKVIAKIKELVQNKKVQGIADLKDLTDRTNGLRIVIEVKNGFNPEAILAQLYKLTPLEESFGINNVALVDGQPLTLGLKELLEVYLDHRFEVVRRRSEFRRKKRQDRFHLVDGLLIALLDIDAVIETIRTSEDSADARRRLMERYELSEVQANYILDTPLRRLTKFDRLELENEQERLRAEIAELTAILESDTLLRKVVSDELAKVAKEYATPRRTALLEADEVPAIVDVPLEVADEPCRVALSTTGLLGRLPAGFTLDPARPRAKHDALLSLIDVTTRADLGVVTSAGQLYRVAVVDVPVMPGDAENLAGGISVRELVRGMAEDEQVLCVMSLNPDSPGVALGTEQGVVKRVVPEYPANKDTMEVITLKDGDRVVGARELRTGREDLVFITSDAQLLKFSAELVRPQGRPAGGMAGIKLDGGASVLSFAVVDPDQDAVVVSVAGSGDTLPGVMLSTIKATPYRLYPSKGRATGGVRCQRFLKGEDRLVFAWAGPYPARPVDEEGRALALPALDERRDGSGAPLAKPIGFIGS
ncbi:DNA gyrase/topoisomerase IV subunit A [Actinospica robiniae]|uniref:DNA gyrase/topoisomerase IV subunit A n=1 Tax=Actinospica robiniae TaxID=304901 RepID=UPI00041E8B50|nr:DNA topoisomerase IV subunit A [Actinospica robiniae]